MKYILSQPANLYYAWQTEVLLHNFMQVHIDLKDVIIVCSGEKDSNWDKLSKTYEANFYFYQNTSRSRYPSIGRPNSLVQHFKLYPELSTETFFYLDCDILFLKSPKKWVEPFIKDEIVYVSDTMWYIGYSYLDTKKFQVTINKEEYDTDKILLPLCKQIGIDLQMLKERDKDSGGAQYLLKGIDYLFWQSVEVDCDLIYKYFNYQFTDSINRKYFHSENDGFQSFCADMWAVLWNIWKRGRETKIVKEFDFGWPGYTMKELGNFNIFHNAGVVNDKEQMFYKSKYINVLPFTCDLSTLDTSKLSFFYAEKVMELKNKTCL